MQAYFSVQNVKKMKKIILLSLIVILGGSWLLEENGNWRDKVDPVLWQRLEKTPEVDFIVLLESQLPLPEARTKRTKAEKGIYVYEQLSKHAQQTQAPLVSLLKARGVAFRSFFIVNALYVKGNEQIIQLMAEQPEVKSIIDNSKIRVAETGGEPDEDIRSRNLIEWGIERINADDVWALGYTGQGVVVAGADTGVEWNHPAIASHYRGADATGGVDHNYNWHDAIHEISPLHNDSIVSPTNNPCGLNSLVPCDDHSHGTHTVGTMAGDDGQGNQIGVAPGARWIACRNMERGWGSPATYIECFEWFLAPTDLNNAFPDPTKAPHVINNSWGCPTVEGCNPSNFEMMDAVVTNLKNAGIVVVVSAGNEGSSCSSVQNPAAIFENSFSVGASRSTDTVANFSSRGPVLVDSSGRLKPNVVAPGVGVRSCTRGGNYASWNGTSMAGPHVAGLVALIISANPDLAGQVDSIENIIEQTAVPLLAVQDCGTSGLEVPNNSYGYGRINALAAVERALQSVTPVTQPDSQAPIVKLFPNPAKDDITLEWLQSRGELSLELFSATGQSLRKWNWAADAAGAQRHFSLTGLPKGVYFYQIKNGERYQSGKLVKN